MNTTVTIDKAGRVVIPKEIRDELRLEAGDTLMLEFEGERVTLRPVRGGTPLQKERGVWVFHGGKGVSLDEANQLVLLLIEVQRQAAHEQRSASG